MPNTRFRERFKYYLRRSRYNQKELARELNIDASAISHRLSGRLPWRADFLERVCERLQITENERLELFELTGLVKATVQVPLQRQNRVLYYINRQTDEVDRIISHLKPGRIVTICGPSGVGKTSLAIEIAWALTPNMIPPDRFPDGIIFHSFYDTPSVALALEHIVRSLHEEPHPTPLLAAQRVLSQRQALVILDGAERADNLGTILTLRGQCSVLVTSRRREDGEEIRYDLGPLPLDKTVSLLQNWAGHRAADHESTEQICEFVGGLPLAVRLIGSYLKQSELDSGEYLTWLRATSLNALDLGQRQRDSVPLLLQRSLEQVSDVAVRTLTVVGLLALSSFDVEAVTAALGLTKTAVTLCLGELVNYSLLDRSHQRYLVTHPLIHTYAQERLSKPATMLTQLAAYYKILAQEESRLGTAGFSRLDLERPHFVALLNQCALNEQWEGWFILGGQLGLHFCKEKRCLYFLL
ncbi:hypothetical protein KFU94_03920 [Chloroflexi bacterium TSY]|nr:hypothetical protein [Chloroflexi bacterium TSY]